MPDRRDDEPLLTTEEIAEYLRKPRSWLDNGAQRLGIPRVKIGKHYRYRLSEINEWLDNMREDT